MPADKKIKALQQKSDCLKQEKKSSCNKDLLEKSESGWTSMANRTLNLYGFNSPQLAENTVILAQARIQRLKPLDTGLRRCDVNTPSACCGVVYYVLFPVWWNRCACSALAGLA